MSLMKAPKKMNTNLKRSHSMLGISLCCLILVLASCGKKNVTPVGTTSVDPANPSGVTTLANVVNAMETSYRCADGRIHTLSTIRFTNNVGALVSAPLSDERFTRITAIGVNCGRDFAVIKDYGTYTDAFLYLCSGTRITTANLTKPVQTSAAFSSRFQRAEIVDMTLTSNSSFGGGIPLTFTSPSVFDRYAASACPNQTGLFNGTGNQAFY